jgi:hypothetical protein
MGSNLRRNDVIQDSCFLHIDLREAGECLVRGKLTGYTSGTLGLKLTVCTCATG